LDLNGNGNQDRGEQGIPSVTIKLYNSKNVLVSQTQTDKKGSYEFMRLAAGTYTVTEVVPAGYINITPMSAVVTVGSNNRRAVIDFGNANPATIKGLKYNDLNSNKKFDNGDQGLPDWTIQLQSSNGSIQTAVTGIGGEYQFANLKPGTYKISEVVKSGYTNTTPTSRMITVTSGQTLNVTANYGLFGNMHAATQKFAYVVNDNSNNVTVFDIATNALVANISVGANPWRIAITPDGAQAYVTNQNDNSVSVIDTSTNGVINTIPVGVAPTDVAFTPSGAIAYVTNGGLGSDVSNVSVIDTASQTVIATIPIGFQPYGVAVSPNGNQAYVTNGEGNVSVIDTTLNTVIANITLGPDQGPAGVTFTPDGTLAFVAEQFNGSVAVINTASRQVVNTIVVGPQIGTFPTNVAVAPNGTLAYVSNSFAHNIGVIDIPSQSVVGSPISVPGIAAFVMISPDGKDAYVSINNLNEVVKIDTVTSQITGSPIPVGSNPQGIAINPDP